jgi:hypothetical protein
MNEQHVLTIVHAMRKVVMKVAIECGPCDGTGRLSSGPGIGKACPECQDARDALALSSDMRLAIKRPAGRGGRA